MRRDKRYATRSVQPTVSGPSKVSCTSFPARFLPVRSGRVNKSPAAKLLQHGLNVDESPRTDQSEDDFVKPGRSKGRKNTNLNGERLRHSVRLRKVDDCKIEENEDLEEFGLDAQSQAYNGYEADKYGKWKESVDLQPRTTLFKMETPPLKGEATPSVPDNNHIHSQKPLFSAGESNYAYKGNVTPSFRPIKIEPDEWSGHPCQASSNGHFSSSSCDNQVFTWMSTGMHNNVNATAETVSKSYSTRNIRCQEKEVLSKTGMTDRIISKRSRPLSHVNKSEDSRPREKRMVIKTEKGTCLQTPLSHDNRLRLNDEQTENCIVVKTEIPDDQYLSCDRSLTCQNSMPLRKFTSNNKFQCLRSDRGSPVPASSDLSSNCKLDLNKQGACNPQKPMENTLASDNKNLKDLASARHERTDVIRRLEKRKSRTLQKISRKSISNDSCDRENTATKSVSSTTPSLPISLLSISTTTPTITTTTSSCSTLPSSFISRSHPSTVSSPPTITTANSSTTATESLSPTTRSSLVSLNNKLFSSGSSGFRPETTCVKSSLQYEKSSVINQWHLASSPRKTQDQNSWPVDSRLKSEVADRNTGQHSSEVLSPPVFKNISEALHRLPESPKVPLVCMKDLIIIDSSSEHDSSTLSYHSSSTEESPTAKSDSLHPQRNNSSSSSKSKAAKRLFVLEKDSSIKVVNNENEILKDNPVSSDKKFAAKKDKTAASSAPKVGSNSVTPKCIEKALSPNNPDPIILSRTDRIRSPSIRYKDDVLFFPLVFPSRSSQSATNRVSEAVERNSNRVSEAVERNSNRVSEAVERNSNRVSEAVERNSNRVSEAVERNSNRVSEAVERNSNRVSEAVERNSNRVSEAVERNSNRVSEAVEQNSSSRQPQAELDEKVVPKEENLKITEIVKSLEKNNCQFKKNVDSSASSKLNESLNQRKFLRGSSVKSKTVARTQDAASFEPVQPTPPPTRDKCTSYANAKTFSATCQLGPSSEDALQSPKSNKVLRSHSSSLKASALSLPCQPLSPPPLPPTKPLLQLSTSPPLKRLNPKEKSLACNKSPSLTDQSESKEKLKKPTNSIARTMTDTKATVPDISYKSPSPAAANPSSLKKPVSKLQSCLRSYSSSTSAIIREPKPLSVLSRPERTSSDNKKKLNAFVSDELDKYLAQEIGNYTMSPQKMSVSTCDNLASRAKTTCRESKNVQKKLLLSPKKNLCDKNLISNNKQSNSNQGDETEEIQTTVAYNTRSNKFLNSSMVAEKNNNLASNSLSSSSTVEESIKIKSKEDEACSKSPEKPKSSPIKTELIPTATSAFSDVQSTRILRPRPEPWNPRLHKPCSSYLANTNIFTNNSQSYEPDFDEVDGVLFMSFPNVESLQAHIAVERKSNWESAPSHMSSISKVLNFNRWKERHKTMKLPRPAFDRSNNLRGLHMRMKMYYKLLRSEWHKIKQRNQHRSRYGFKKTNDFSKIKSWQAMRSRSLDGRRSLNKLNWRTQDRLASNMKPNEIRQLGVVKRRKKKFILTHRKKSKFPDFSRRSEEMENSLNRNKSSDDLSENENNQTKQNNPISHKVVKGPISKTNSTSEISTVLNSAHLLYDSDEINRIKKLGGCDPSDHAMRKRTRSQVELENLHRRNKNLPPIAPDWLTHNIAQLALTALHVDFVKKKNPSPGKNVSSDDSEDKHNTDTFIQVDSKTPRVEEKSSESMLATIPVECQKSSPVVVSNATMPSSAVRHCKTNDEDIAKETARILLARQKLKANDEKCNKPGCRYGCICHLCWISENFEDTNKTSAICTKSCDKEYCRLGCICDSNDNIKFENLCNEKACTLECCQCSEYKSFVEGMRKERMKQKPAIPLKKINASSEKNGEKSNFSEEVIDLTKDNVASLSLENHVESDNETNKKSLLVEKVKRPRRDCSVSEIERGRTPNQDVKNLDAFKPKTLTSTEGSEIFQPKKKRKINSVDRNLAKVNHTKVSQLQTKSSSAYTEDEEKDNSKISPPLSSIKRLCPLRDDCRQPLEQCYVNCSWFPANTFDNCVVEIDRLSSPQQLRQLGCMSVDYFPQSPKVNPNPNPQQIENCIGGSNTSNGSNRHNDCIKCELVDLSPIKVKQSASSVPAKGTDSILNQSKSNFITPPRLLGEVADSEKWSCPLIDLTEEENSNDKDWQVTMICLKAKADASSATNIEEPYQLLEFISNCNWDSHSSEVIYQVSLCCQPGVYPDPQKIVVGDFDVEILPKSNKASNVPAPFQSEFFFCPYNIRVKVTDRTKATECRGKKNEPLLDDCSYVGISSLKPLHNNNNQLDIKSMSLTAILQDINYQSQEDNEQNEIENQAKNVVGEIEVLEIHPPLDDTKMAGRAFVLDLSTENLKSLPQAQVKIVTDLPASHDLSTEQLTKSSVQENNSRSTTPIDENSSKSTPKHLTTTTLEDSPLKMTKTGKTCDSQDEKNKSKTCDFPQREEEEEEEVSKEKKTELNSNFSVPNPRLEESAKQERMMEKMPVMSSFHKLLPTSSLNGGFVVTSTQSGVSSICLGHLQAGCLVRAGLSNFTPSVSHNHTNCSSSPIPCRLNGAPANQYLQLVPVPVPVPVPVAISVSPNHGTIPVKNSSCNTKTSTPLNPVISTSDNGTSSQSMKTESTCFHSYCSNLTIASNKNGSCTAFTNNNGDCDMKSGNPLNKPLDKSSPSSASSSVNHPGHILLSQCQNNAILVPYNTFIKNNSNVDQQKHCFDKRHFLDKLPATKDAQLEDIKSVPTCIIESNIKNSSTCQDLKTSIKTTVGISSKDCFSEKQQTLNQDKRLFQNFKIEHTENKLDETNSEMKITESLTNIEATNSCSSSFQSGLEFKLDEYYFDDDDDDDEGLNSFDQSEAYIDVLQSVDEQRTLVNLLQGHSLGSNSLPKKQKERKKLSPKKRGRKKKKKDDKTKDVKKKNRKRENRTEHQLSLHKTRERERRWSIFNGIHLLQQVLFSNDNIQITQKKILDFATDYIKSLQTIEKDLSSEKLSLIQTNFQLWEELTEVKEKLKLENLTESQLNKILDESGLPFDMYIAPVEDGIKLEDDTGSPLKLLPSLDNCETSDVDSKDPSDIESDELDVCLVSSPLPSPSSGPLNEAHSSNEDTILMSPVTSQQIQDLEDLEKAELLTSNNSNETI